MCTKAHIDLGNGNYKLDIYNKQVINCSNVEEVTSGTFGSYEIDGKHYIFGENAKSRKQTNKIVDEKRALLGYALYSSLDEETTKVDVVTTLPLSLYVLESNKKAYEELLKGKYSIVNPYGVKRNITVGKVEVYCEGFSSLITMPSLLKEQIFLIDFGATDLTGVKVNGTPDIKSSFCKEAGANILYNELAKVITAYTRDTYSDKDIKILLKKFDELDSELQKVIDDFMSEYIKKNIYDNLKDIGYKPLLGTKIVAIGGGSLLVKRYLEKDSNVIILDNALFSSIEGAKILSVRRAGK